MLDKTDNLRKPTQLVGDDVFLLRALRFLSLSPLLKELCLASKQECPLHLAFTAFSSDLVLLCWKGQVTHLRFLYGAARTPLTKRSGKWWSGNRHMSGSEHYPMTFAAADTCLLIGMFLVLFIHVVACSVAHSRHALSKVADCLTLRNRHSAVFLMSTDIGRMLDHIALALIQQACVTCNAVDSPRLL